MRMKILILTCALLAIYQTSWTANRYFDTKSIETLTWNAASRKSHSGSIFEVAMPLTGTAGIECRTGGSTHDFTLVVYFNEEVTVDGSPNAELISGTGDIGTNGTSNGGMVSRIGGTGQPTQVIIPLTNITNAQTISVRLNGINNSFNVTVPMSVLLGDTTASGSVTSADVSQTNSRTGQPVAGGNFRSDVNLSDSINSSDVALVQSELGTGLP